MPDQTGNQIIEGQRPPSHHYALIFIVVAALVGALLLYTFVMSEPAQQGASISSPSEAQKTMTDIGRDISGINSDLEDISSIVGA